MLYLLIILFMLVAALVFVISKLSRKLAAVFAVLGFPLLIYASLIEPRWVKTTRFSVPITGLTAPLTAVVIGDLQPTRLHFSKTSMQAIIDRAVAEQPDIVFWVGDYAYQPLLFERLPWLPDPVFFKTEDTVDAMATLTAPMGVYAVLGNHDWWWNGPEVLRLLGQTQIKTLLDEAVLARHPKTGAALWIAGLEDVSTPRFTDPNAVVAQTDPSAPIIALTHSPDVLPLVPPQAAFTFAGHTHCGQVGVPGVQQAVAPIQRKEYACGFAAGPEGQRLYVTSGIGTSALPIRFLARPEIVVVTFVPDG
ncbi:MAG: metallophosphoesterase [Pseudomonadota bacterium]